MKKRLKIQQNTQNQILQTIKYFSFFNYPPNFDETYLFLKKRVSKHELWAVLEDMIEKGAVTRLSIREILTSKPKNQQADLIYTLGEYSIRGPKSERNPVKYYLEKYRISQKKLQNWKFKIYLKLLSFFPQIKLVGLSGTLAMNWASEGDDIDLFVVTGENRLFTGRFIAIGLAQMMGVRRIREDFKHENKVCLNLWFDIKNLTVPKFKRTEYVAHEVLQMKPLINKNQTYERFLETNNWIYRIFPNASETKEKLKLKYQNFDFRIFDSLEFFLKKLQQTSIKKHQTNEYITETQLWFHPEDFSKRIK